MVIAYDPTRSALYTPETQDTVFQGGQSYAPLQLAVEGARLAYYRAEQSPAQMQRLTDALARAGFATPDLFIDNIRGAAGFGTRHTSVRTALLAFRGTQPDDISDIAHDLEATLNPWPESAGRVHAGFAAELRGLLPQINEWISDTKLDSEQLIVTGHSLGAAMATLAASVLHPDWLVTLGSPRVGDAAFLATVQASNIHRIVDCCDAVTRVPPPVGGYTHLPTCTYLSRTAQVLSDPEDSFIEADRMKAREDYLVHYAWKLGAVLVRDLADHAPINYVRAFFA
jgi:pimeloyl-ACP methyl ester carboxylesterase